MWYIILKMPLMLFFLKKSCSKLLNMKCHPVGKKNPLFVENHSDFGKGSIYFMSNICQRG